MNVLLDDTGYPQVSQRLRGQSDRRRRGLLPRFRAASHQVDDFVDALCHALLLLSMAAGAPEHLVGLNVLLARDTARGLEEGTDGPRDEAAASSFGGSPRTDVPCLRGPAAWRGPACPST